MISKCPGCHKALNFSPEQKKKLEQTLQRMEQGKLLTLKCPFCQYVIKLDKNGQSQAADPSLVIPPSPPDLEWLTTGIFDLEDKVEDVPTALILFKDSPERKRICEAMEAVGYQLIVLESYEEALERMRFVQVACIVYQDNLDGPLAESPFHQYMCKLTMDRRRYIFYILIGQHFSSLYDLEALANSANLTVNSKDLKHLEVILRKAIPDYEKLFGTYMEELNAFGRR
ncbi:hypothetical protein [Desulfogranum japonicum]|uniref:hypothetical protein n=1 Tax=Desulfogranum japonicum TaxID=231447 RepID=UPI00040E3653|nr:hypothetical protein [Desulfogranum japonicum]